MKNKLMKKTLAAVMALAIVGGAMPTAFGGTPLLTTPIVANAADGYATLNGDTLTIGGNIKKDILDGYRENSNVKHIVAAEDTILPVNSSYLFYARDALNEEQAYWLNLQTIDLSNADMSQVTNMHGIFMGCGKLQSINFGNCNTSNVTEMAAMFLFCESLISLDLSGFNTSSLTNTDAMFANCFNLKFIIVSDNWDVSNVTDSEDMFYRCENLKGQNGLNSSSNLGVSSGTLRDKTYARIDTEEAPGYLSEAGYAPSFVDFDNTTGTLSIGGWITRNDVHWYQQTAGIKHIIALEGTVLPKNSSFMFNGMAKLADNEECWTDLETIDLSKADTSKVTDPQLLAVLLSSRCPRRHRCKPLR